MGLTEVIAEVRRDGETKASAIVADARREAAGILDAAKAQAKAYESARLEAASRESTQIASQSASRGESEARKAILATEAGLREQLRAKLLAGFADLPAKTREKHLAALLKQAQGIIPKGHVWGSAQDTAYLAANKAYKHAGSEPIAGGIIVESEDGLNRIDLTYETLLDDAWRDILKAEAGLFQ